MHKMLQPRARAPRCCGYNPYPGAVPQLKSGLIDRGSKLLGGTKGSIVQGGARGCGFIGMTRPHAQFGSPLARLDAQCCGDICERCKGRRGAVYPKIAVLALGGSPDERP